MATIDRGVDFITIDVAKGGRVPRR